MSAVHFSPGVLGTLPTSDPPVEPRSSHHHFHFAEEEAGLERGRTARGHVRLWMLGSIPAALASTLFPLHLCTSARLSSPLCTSALLSSPPQRLPQSPGVSRYAGAGWGKGGESTLTPSQYQHSAQSALLKVCCLCMFCSGLLHTLL